jgi:hypothetical protein
LGGFDGVTVLRAATHASSSHCSPPTWHVVETANFKILNYGTEPVDQDTSVRCEQLRASLVGRWLDDDARWRPKCHVVIHPSEASYLREVGQAGRSTVASALVKRDRGRIALRRIDVRDAKSSAFGHELTHVILADRFTRAPLPRWVDEGIAILADSTDKQRRHARDFERALAHGSEFRLVELVAMDDYPPPGRWGAFYGQSASLVNFLVEQSGEARFLEFVAASLDDGYHAGLRQTYGLSVAQLEGRWRVHARQLASRSTAPQMASTGNSAGPTATVD